MSKGNGNSSKPKVMRVLQGEEAQAYLKRVQKKAKAEFKEWKAELCKIINQQSQLVFNRDASYQFILPSKLVKLVWSTTLQERIKAAKLAGAKDATEAKKAAIEKLRQELDQAHQQFTQKQEETEANVATDEAAKEQAEREEQEAAESLAKLREELVKQQQGGEEAKDD